MKTFDAVVIGAGAMGSATAYYLSQRQQKVLLLEQFELDHRMGSSYGFSRIIRYAYDHSEYVELAKDNYPLWFSLQDKLGETLYVKTGGLDFGPRDDDTLNATIAALKSSQIQHEMLSIDEAQNRFPQFRFDDDFLILYQPDSGLIAASKAVLGHIKLAKQNGAAVKDHTAVEKIVIHTNSVEVQTEQETFSAAKLIVTAGSWARSLLLQTGIDLPLTPLRCQLNFITPANPAAYEVERCPVWIAHVQGPFPIAAYGLPSHDDSGFKIAWHGGPAVRHPSEIDYTPDAENLVGLRQFMRAHLPALANAPLRESRICLYTQTPDEHFIIDAHPEHSHVLIGAGFSGHGFKFSTIIGKMLTDLALDGATPHNDALFKIDRFIS